jgi:hypothetical protein
MKLVGHKICFREMKITDKIVTEKFKAKRPLGRYLLKENIKIDFK